MSRIPMSERTRRPRPQFWIADDVETGCIAPAHGSLLPSNTHALVAARSVPIDEEPEPPTRLIGTVAPSLSEKLQRTQVYVDSCSYSTSPSAHSPTSPRRSKLLAHPDYYPGFLERDDSNHGKDVESQATRWDDGGWRMARRIMLVTILLAALYAVGLLGFIVQSSHRFRPDFDLDFWIRWEGMTAIGAIMANIGSHVGAADGIFVASPSTGADDEPNYLFTWTRDAALTLSSAILPLFLPEAYLRPWQLGEDQPKPGNRSDGGVEALVRRYVTAQSVIQTTPNPSGDLWTGGLSEPKFMIDGKPFTGSWGRPQRDGPALRALALSSYAHWLLDQGRPEDIEYVTSNLYDPNYIRHPGSVIKNDLEEVANAWFLPGFDLWEEVNGHHLWTDATSRRALQAGATLAARLNDTGAASYYTKQADQIATNMQKYATSGLWNASSPTPNGRTGLDAGTVLAVLHTGCRNMTDTPAATDSVEMNPTDPMTLATLREYILSFAKLYDVNKRRKWTDGWLVGRYAEDVYDGVGFTGGNPWYIATFSVANMLYVAQEEYARAGVIEFAKSKAFWGDLGFKADAAFNGERKFKAALRRLGEVADAFVAAAARTVDNGHLSEQIDRKNGKPRGARDLTWSYASFLSMSRARDYAKAAMAMLEGR